MGTIVSQSRFPVRPVSCFATTVGKSTSFPVGPGDVLFGKPVEGRTLHSVRTLSVETGLHPKRLRAAGTLSAADGLAEGWTSPVRC
jgi:hypothetical protein